MRFASLGSGSKGNSTVVEADGAALLVDLGFTLKETERRLRRLGLAPAGINGILVTHEHADHIHGVAPFARKYGVPVYLSHGSRNGYALGLLPSVHMVRGDRPFELGPFRVNPVTVPHDAREPCQYVVEAQSRRLGVLTDLGHITAHVAEQYRDCDALLLECNHDVGMLARGPYPQALKQRVGGALGHLNNQQAAFLLSQIDRKRLRHLVISHISEQNNQPAAAIEAVREALTDWSGALLLAEQEAGLAWVEMVDAATRVDLHAEA